ncbi:hypothetical protein FACS1894187_17860 [Synergistales bacterium]|nr:hypothetical protein FACS1894187_17860 [Synergistales bacterium]
MDAKRYGCGRPTSIKGGRAKIKDGATDKKRRATEGGRPYVWITYLSALPAPVRYEQREDR